MRRGRSEGVTRRKRDGVMFVLQCVSSGLKLRNEESTCHGIHIPLFSSVCVCLCVLQ